MEKFIPVEDAVLRDTFWSAAIDLKKENDELKQRINRLEDIINRAHLAFFSDSSHRNVSIAMHRILDEEVRKESR
jgi:flagellar basal body-associated protein FliL